MVAAILGNPTVVGVEAGLFIVEVFVVTYQHPYGRIDNLRRHAVKVLVGKECVGIPTPTVIFSVAFVPTDSRGNPPNVPGYPNNVASFQNSFLMLALVGKTGSFGGNNLPVTLQKLGLPNTNSSCALGIQWIPGLQLGLKYFKGILPSFGNLGSLALQPEHPIPNNSKLANVTFYAQAVSNDNGFIYPSSALWAKLGSGASVPGAVVYITNDNPSNPSATGKTVQKGITAVRLSY